ncbi:MAG: histidine triad nucleotide-binding protein [Acidobacteria bacterium]|nr:histidine triad nucleotide-binding protein [Acidobacteriota bacterium]
MTETNPASANPSCLFCKIVAGQIPAKIAYADDSCIGFHDLNPQAPVHILLIPRKHFASAGEASSSDETVLGHLHRVAAQLAAQMNLTGGHRVVMNTGSDAGQTVFHAHLHLLGGRGMAWPPG